MKKLKLFFALFAMLALNVGNAWAEEVTLDFSALYNADTDVSSTEFKVVEGITLKFAKENGSTAPKYYDSGTSVRLYAKGTMTISSTIGNITGITLAYGTNDKTNEITTDCGTFSSPNWTGTASSVIFTIGGTSGHRRIKSVAVTYTPSSGGGENPGEGEGEDPVDPTPGAGGTGTINFNSNAVKINAASVTGQDNLNNTWTITTVGTTSFTSSNAYYQVGSSSKPATSITFTTTLPQEGTVTDFSAKFGGFSGTAGTVTLKVGDTSVGTGSLNGTSDVVVENSSEATGKTLTVTMTGIAKGVKVYYISYTYTTASSGDEPETPKTDLTDAQFAWPAATAEATMGAANTFPTLTNTLGLTVTYDSSNKDAATIAADGTITLVAPGTTTISAKFAGGEVSGTTYAAKTVTYALTVLKAPAIPTDNVYVKVTTTAGITDGEYLIVYEDATAPVAFDGSLEALDAVGNTLEVTINNNTIAGTNYIDAATFTIDVTNGTILSASGKYIGKTANSNGLDVKTTALTNTFAIDANGNAVITGNTAALRYNKTADQKRFRYYKDGGGSQEKIALYKKASKHTVTIADCTNGTVSAKMGETALATNDQVLFGIQITLSNEAATGYKLAAYDVYKTGEESTKVTVADDYTFIMPEFDVTISATFEQVKTLTGIEITTPATQNTFWQGETFNSTGLKVTAHFDGAEDEDVTDKVTVTGSTATSGTQTVTVSFKEGEITKDVTYTITVKAIPNTKETAYSVADAFDIIDKLGETEGIYITGTISQVDSYSSTYKSITYWISADGTTTNQLQVYSGKGLESADFSGKTDLSVGDQVIVCGNLKKYSGTYEFDKNNYLASHTPTTKDPAGLAYATTEYTANVGEPFTTPELTNPHNLVVTYSTSDASKATVNVNTGEVTIVAAGEVTITASTTGDATHDAGSASYTITVTAVATLPFAFDGKQADIENTPGMSHDGIDATDYKESPYLKMNTTGDWLVIRFDSEPEKLSYDIENNSFSGGTFSVLESADGETYTDVAVHTTIEGTQNEEYTLLSTSRYVKFIYTEKVNGNVALGNIKITKPDLRQEAGIAWSAETTTITIGDAFTAPTLSNPNDLTLACSSDNETLATVTNTGAITLKEGVTGKAVITAKFAGNEDYKSAEVTTTIIVSPETGDVVILAKHQGKWYAMKAEYPTIEGSEKKDCLVAIPVYYVNGKLYNVSEEDKAAITWTRSAYGDNTVSFQNDGKYLKGKSSTTLILEEDEDGLYKWNADDNTMIIGETTRTFLYHKDGIFRNFSITLARETSLTYSNLPVVTAPEFATGNVYTISTSAEKGTAKGADTYVEGSTVTLMADPAMDYTFVNWTKNGEVVSTANPYVFTASEDINLVANFQAIKQTEILLSGTFSVGKYEVAQFATGNLQYNVKDEKWSFAKQQYQYIGDANINVGDPAFTGTIDLFGWSNGENNNFGANQSGNKNDYKGEFVDWGTLFPAEDNWSTLSHEQWDYLLNKRGAGKKQIARVGTVFGVMLFPDVWNAPLTVKAQYDNYFKINVYNYTLDQWTKLERAGAVFFPAAGRRYGGYGNKYIYDGITNLGDEYKLQYRTNDLAAYYTSTKHNDDRERVSYLLNLGNGGAKYSTLELGWYEYGHVGQSVRLAKVTPLVEIGDGDNSAVITENAEKTVNVQVNRTFEANRGYYTICLPFDLAAEKIGKALQISSITENIAEQGMNVVFTEVTNLVAGQPYLVLPSENLTNPIFENVTIVNTTGKTTATVTGAGINITFTGIINGSGTTNGSTEYYVGNNGYLYNKPTAKLGLRAFFTITDAAGQEVKNIRARVVTREDAATGFENITNGENTTIKMIENGQLIIIRNGEKFNAQGVRL